MKKVDKKKLAQAFANPDECVELEKISRDVIRSVGKGRTIRFILPTPKATESARASVNFLRIFEDLPVFASVNNTKRWITITRL